METSARLQIISWRRESGLKSVARRESDGGRDSTSIWMCALGYCSMKVAVESIPDGQVPSAHDTGAITDSIGGKVAASLRQPRDPSEKKPAMRAGELTRSHRDIAVAKAAAMS
jgi:hypothetical protein